MKACHVLLSLAFLCFKSGEAYSKYGRTCKDIGCATNEECVMAETPCSYYTRENECGSYPTCRKTSNAAPTCATYICPPTKKCIVDGADPKCVDDDAANVPGNQNGNKAYQTYNTQNINDNNPSAPSQGVNHYPVLPGQTTTRAPIRRPGYQGQGGGYQGGSVGSGYPGQSSGGYQGGSVGSGYPGQSSGGYQGGSVGSGYPGQSSGGYQGGSAGSGYTGQSGGYQGGSSYPRQQGGGYRGGSVGSGYNGQGGYQGGYQQPGYQGGYQQPGQGSYPGYNNQGGYNNNNYNQRRPQQQPPQNSGSSPIYDTLKKYGTNILKNALSNIKF